MIRVTDEVAGFQIVRSQKNALRLCGAVKGLVCNPPTVLDGGGTRPPSMAERAGRAARLRGASEVGGRPAVMEGALRGHGRKVHSRSMSLEEADMDETSCSQRGGEREGALQSGRKPSI